MKLQAGEAGGVVVVAGCRVAGIGREIKVSRSKANRWQFRE